MSYRAKCARKKELNGQPRKRRLAAYRRILLGTYTQPSVYAHNWWPVQLRKERA